MTEACTVCDNLSRGIIPYSASYGEGYITNLYGAHGEEVADPREAYVLVAYIQAGELAGKWITEDMKDCAIKPLVRN